MARHIVGTFVGMGEVGGVVGHEPIHESFKVMASARVCIFHEHEAAAGVATEDGDDAISESTFAESVASLVATTAVG